MTIQLKHVNVDIAASRAARFLAGLADLTPRATVVLFRAMVLNEDVGPFSEVGRELIAKDFFNPFGKMRKWVADQVEEHIELCVAEAGADLTPMHEPTTIQQLGHKAVKGRSKTSAQVRLAERIMTSTAFQIDDHVLEVARRNEHLLTDEDRMVVFVSSRDDVRGQAIYFPVSYDYRGRMYYRGGILTPQGADLSKGLLRFADARPLGKHGLQALAYALADALGYKGPKTGTNYWLNATDSRLREVAQGLHLKQKGGTLKGFQAVALAKEYLEALASDNPEEFMSSIVCHQDATCSGLQIAAAVTGHRATAQATNCTAATTGDIREDVYGDVSQIIADSDTALGAIAREHGRDAFKFAVMTLGYGAGKATLIRTVADYLKDEGLYEGDTENWDMDDASREVFFGALEEKCGATVGLLEQLKEAVDTNVEDVGWVTADGFVVYQDKRSGDVIQLGRFAMTFNEATDGALQSTAIAPNVVHSIDATQMRMAVRFVNDSVACVHDSLGTHAGNYYTAAVGVRKAFTEAQPRQTVEKFLDDRGKTLQLLGDYQPQEAMQSAYFWC